MASEHVMMCRTGLYQESRSNSIRAHTIHTDALNLRISDTCLEHTPDENTCQGTETISAKLAFAQHAVVVRI